MVGARVWGHVVPLPRDVSGWAVRAGAGRRLGQDAWAGPEGAISRAADREGLTPDWVGVGDGPGRDWDGHDWASGGGAGRAGPGHGGRTREEPRIGDVPGPGLGLGTGGAGRGGPGWRRAWLRVGGAWPLLVVVAVQVVLSLRLVRLDTAFEDEAAYLAAGRLEWGHWLHGGLIPPFAAYFSGAPVVYPPVGAVADGVGGLAGARVLSLVFMVGASVALWGVVSRLWGRAAAFFAVALFGLAGPTLHLGAFATFDAMSVFFVALAVWLVVSAGERADAAGWMVAAGAALAVANAASYASVLFDPVVVVVALLVALPRPGGKSAAGRCVILVTVLGVLLAAGLLAGGTSYVTGVEQTTLLRVGGGDPAWSVVAAAWSWTGLVAVAAGCGAVISWAGGQGRARTGLLAVCALAVLLAPGEQAWLHTMASLNKHVDTGVWFASIAAGYAVGRLAAAVPPGWMRVVTRAACVAALAFPVVLGAAQSRVFATDWPNAFSFTAIFGPLAAHDSGRLLVEDPSIAEYYLHVGSTWTRWSSTRNIVLPSGASTGGPAATAGVTGPGNAGVFAEFITNSYFSLVALNFADTTTLDRAIAADLRANPRYHIIDVVPYGPHGTYVIWQRELRP
jgi:Dolichyl-phosphate-mannose-protein mannosyltransferase